MSGEHDYALNDRYIPVPVSGASELLDLWLLEKRHSSSSCVYNTAQKKHLDISVLTQEPSAPHWDMGGPELILDQLCFKER